MKQKHEADQTHTTQMMSQTLILIPMKKKMKKKMETITLSMQKIAQYKKKISRLRHNKKLMRSSMKQSNIQVMNQIPDLTTEVKEALEPEPKLQEEQQMSVMKKRTSSD